MVVCWCKKDLVYKNRNQYIIINSKVLKILKGLDPESQMMLRETGLINSQAHRR
jgi:hypothetical protein